MGGQQRSEDVDDDWREQVGHAATQMLQATAVQATVGLVYRSVPKLAAAVFGAAPVAAPGAAAAVQEVAATTTKGALSTLTGYVASHPVVALSGVALLFTAVLVGHSLRSAAAERRASALGLGEHARLMGRAQAEAALVARAKEAAAQVAALEAQGGEAAVARRFLDHFRKYPHETVEAVLQALIPAEVHRLNATLGGAIPEGRLQEAIATACRLPEVYEAQKRLLTAPPPGAPQEDRDAYQRRLALASIPRVPVQRADYAQRRTPTPARMRTPKQPAPHLWATPRGPTRSRRSTRRRRSKRRA